jgi:hypothetical protein
MVVIERLRSNRELICGAKTTTVEKKHLGLFVVPA